MIKILLLLSLLLPLTGCPELLALVLESAHDLERDQATTLRFALDHGSAYHGLVPAVAPYPRH